MHELIRPTLRPDQGVRDRAQGNICNRRRLLSRATYACDPQSRPSDESLDEWCRQTRVHLLGDVLRNQLLCQPHESS